MYKHFWGLVLFFLLLPCISCNGPANEEDLEKVQTGGSKENVEIRRSVNETEPTPIKDEQIEPLFIGDSLGLLVPKPEEAVHDRVFRVRLFNSDGSKWREYVNSKSGMDFDSDYQPFRYSSSEAYTALRVTDRLEDRYEVIVNESTGIRKFVLASDPNFVFWTWGEYILNCFAVSFDRSTNPIRSAPGGSEQIGVQPTFPIKPRQIEGDWLQVGWKSEKTTDEENTGWIKWKEGEYIVVYFFEIS